MSDSEGGHSSQPMTRTRLQEELEDPGPQWKQLTAVKGAEARSMSV